MVECPFEGKVRDNLARIGKNLFAITRFHYSEVLFHIFYYYWGKENRSLYRELRYIDSGFVVSRFQGDDFSGTCHLVIELKTARVSVQGPVRS